MKSAWLCICLALLPGLSEAQTPAAPEGGEHAQIQALQTEVARLQVSLAELAARVDQMAQARPPVVAPVAALVAAASRSVDVTAPSAPPRFDFYGDTLVRLSTLHQSYDGCSTCPGRTVERFRLRFGVEGRLAPGLRAVMGIASGELNDPNSVYQTFGGNLGRKVTTWDRGYVFFRPTRAPWLELTAGKFPYPWVRSSMTFDLDFYPEGATARASFDLKRAGALKNISFQGLQVIVNEQAAGPDTMLVGGQATASFRPRGPVATRVVASVMDIRRPEHVLRAQFDGTDVGVRNTNAIIGTGAQAFYASQFRYANVIVENQVTTPWPSMPIAASVEYQRNVRAVTTRDSAQSIRLDAGRQQRPGDWGLGWHLFRVEQDAIMSSLGESDWRAPSNVLQQRIAVTRMMQEHVQTLFTWYRGRTLDRTIPGALTAPGLPAGRRDPWVNRFYFDVLYRF